MSDQYLVETFSGEAEALENSVNAYCEANDCYIEHATLVKSDKQGYVLTMLYHFCKNEEPKHPVYNVFAKDGESRTYYNTGDDLIQRKIDYVIRLVEQGMLYAPQRPFFGMDREHWAWRCEGCDFVTNHRAAALNHGRQVGMEHVVRRPKNVLGMARKLLCNVPHCDFIHDEESVLKQHLARFDHGNGWTVRRL